MPLTPYLAKPFEHGHEEEMFARLVDNLTKKTEKLGELYILIGNLSVGGEDLDALLIKKSGITVIELKAHGGLVLFDENLPWQVGTSQVRGGGRANPYLQVKAYRHAVHHFLKAKAGLILSRHRELAWRNVAAKVVFGRPISFDDAALGPNLRLWFSISDLDHSAEQFLKLKSTGFDLIAEEVERVAAVFRLSDEHRYAPNSAPAVSAPPADVVEPGQARKVVYLKEFRFREHFLRLSTLGGAGPQVAERIRAMFIDIQRGLNPFVSLPLTDEPRIVGAKRYNLGQGFEIIVVEHEYTIFPAFVGTKGDADGWCDAHAGSVVSYDHTGRMSLTTVTLKDPTVEDLKAQGLSAETEPFLRRLDNFSPAEYGIPKLASKILLHLDDASTPQDIEDALDLIQSEDLRRFFFDLINLLRANDIKGAEERRRLREGDAISGEDAGALAAEAASLPINSDQALVVNKLSEEELRRLLDPQNFDEWMLFLHPDQREFADAVCERPMVLTGVSGSGKTCILVHRARTLALRYPGQRIGILTLSRTLALLLQNLVDRLCTPEERANIHVMTFYDHLRSCLQHCGIGTFCEQLNSILPEVASMRNTLQNAASKWPKDMVWECDPVNSAHVDDEWDEFYMQQNPDVLEWMSGVMRYLESARVDASRYLEEEMTYIRSSSAIPNREREYLARERAGRSISFKEDVRRDVLRIALFWEDWLLHGGMIDSLGLTLALLPMHKEMQEMPENLKFRCLLIDEFQDLSSLDLQVLRRCVPLSEPDALFITGDTVQRILVKRLRMREAGLERGPAEPRSIKKNYRNSRQILRAAAGLANFYGNVAKSQGEEIEVLDPELAERETNVPMVIQTDRQIEKAWELILDYMEGESSALWTHCIVTTVPKKITTADILAARPSHMKARVLQGDTIKNNDEVTVASINDLKGFEFRVVIIVGCQSGLLPDPGVPEQEVWRDALRLYVAMTRGRDHVYLLHEGEPSEFLAAMGDTVLYRQEGCSKNYRKAGLPSAPKANGPAKKRASLGVLVGDPTFNCLEMFEPVELAVLERYFAQHAYRTNLSFREWCCVKNLRELDFAKLVKTRNVGRRSASLVLSRLEKLGLIPRQDYRSSRSNRKPGRCRTCGSNFPMTGSDQCYTCNSK
jgi:hypothetical protein